MKKSITAVLLSLAMLSGTVAFAQTNSTSSATPPAGTVTSPAVGTLGAGLSALNKDAEQQIRALRQEMEAKIKAIRQEYKAKIDAIRQAAKDKASQIRQQFKTQRDQFNAQREQNRQKERELREQRRKDNRGGARNSTSTPPAQNR